VRLNRARHSPDHLPAARLPHFICAEGLIVNDEVDSCVAMVDREYDRRGTRYGAGRRGAAYRVRRGELLLNGER